MACAQKAAIRGQFLYTTHAWAALRAVWLPRLGAKPSFGPRWATFSSSRGLQANHGCLGPTARLGLQAPRRQLREPSGGGGGAGRGMEAARWLGFVPRGSGGRNAATRVPTGVVGATRVQRSFGSRWRHALGVKPSGYDTKHAQPVGKLGERAARADKLGCLVHAVPVPGKPRGSPPLTGPPPPASWRASTRSPRRGSRPARSRPQSRARAWPFRRRARASARRARTADPTRCETPCPG